MIIFFIILGLFSLSVFFILYLKHLHKVRVLSNEELTRIINERSSPFKEVDERFFTPITKWLFRAVPLLFYGATESIMKKIRNGLIRVESLSANIIYHIQGRRDFIDRTRRSPFWKEMNDWRNGLKKNEHEFKSAEKDKDRTSSDSSVVR